MSLSSSSETSTAASDTQAPLLQPHQPDGSTARSASPAQVSGRATGQVRETAARELEERRADWGNSKPVVALDMFGNAAFVVVSVVMLFCTGEERPNTPIRVWVCGYALLCLIHAVLVLLEYRRRNSRRTPVRDEERGIAVTEDEEGGIGRSLFGSNESIVTKRGKSANTMASLLWWMVGFYWVVSGEYILFQNAPRLYWLAVVFLAFDVVVGFCCVCLAALIAIALLCCLPCILKFLYAVSKKEGASKQNCYILPKYRFQTMNNGENAAGKMVRVGTSSGSVENERILLPEDAVCSVCLCSYEDGMDLLVLPCNHHFHSTCIVKWLKMNACCPLCKCKILKARKP